MLKMKEAGVLLFSLTLVLGGLYLWRQGLNVFEEGAVSGVATPKKSPTELLTYPGATILSRSESPKTTQLTLETADPLSRVYDFYSAVLPAAGWAKEKEQKTDDGVQMDFSREGQSLELNLITNLETKKTVVVAYLTP